MEFDSISGVDVDWLERPFDEDEVTGVVREVVKGHVLSMLNEFAQQERFARSLNATFIVLIPKKPGAFKLKDFCPISLVGGVYKVFAKMLN